MIVYLSMMAWILLVGALSRKRAELNPLTGKKELRATKGTMFCSMFYIVFFIGLRSAGSDTHAYISSYLSAETGLYGIKDVFQNGLSLSESPGFAIIEVLIKTVLGSNYHVWLFLIAWVSGMSVAKTLRRHTPYFIDAMLLFILMGFYSWMINGIRQFVTVALSFSAVDRLVQRKWKSYFMIILLLSTIHKSAIVMIPMYFIVTGEAWNKKTVLLICAGICAVLFVGQTQDMWDVVMEAAGYDADIYVADDGSSFIRTLIFAVPPVIAFIYRRDIAKAATPLINVCINMSIVAVVLSLIANVTSGVLVGRMPIFFSIYNLILLPWLIRHIPRKSLRMPIYFSMYVLYLILNIIEGFGYYYSDLLFGGRVIR